MNTKNAIRAELANLQSRILQIEDIWLRSELASQLEPILELAAALPPGPRPESQQDWSTIRATLVRERTMRQGYR